jgi:hypothetical protein
MNNNSLTKALSEGLTADALNHYRRLILVSKENPVSAIIATCRIYGVPTTRTAVDLYKAHPHLQTLTASGA